MAGDGTYVDNTEDHVDEMAAGWMAGRNVWLEKFDSTMELVNQLIDMTTPIYVRPPEPPA